MLLLFYVFESIQEVSSLHIINVEKRYRKNLFSIVNELIFINNE